MISALFQPENILCTTEDSSEVKIIDFGLSQRVDPKKMFHVLFGTADFVAPEIVNYEPVGLPTDMWSIGVIAYVL
jgi:myosin-light-chain kinase